jgi:3-(methylsulfanyl)propanoyl-CoA dehydrogenase
MSYRSPVADILFSLKHVAGFQDALEAGLFGDLDMETAASVISGAGRFATEKIAPLDRTADEIGAVYENGVVTSPPGYRDAFRQWAEAGWAGVTASPEQGGMGLPHSVNTACAEMWNGASMGFAVCPLLSEGAIGALNAHGSEALRSTYLTRLVSGEWTGTMNLTEPQSGSDLNGVKTRAERAADGTYRVFGQKIFISYGEHDFTDNIVHLVLARLPDAPAGTRGLSLFLVPKYLPKPDGSVGERNDVRCAGIEHKLGIHGSPTCVMVYGDAGGATGWLVGEENRGLNAMFVMMNSARLAVGIQGVAIAEKALQHALAYARERRQGRTPSSGAAMGPIIEHPDVHRMLLTMKALVQASRGICHLTAMAIDRSFHASSAEERAAAGERAALLTPIAKAFSTDMGDEVASLGVQVHGGMGYIEETGAAQYLRDSRINAIYEGTNGVQAVDLVQRKLSLSGGAVVAREIAAMRATASEVAVRGEAGFGATAGILGETLDALDQATTAMRVTLGDDPNAALSGATAYLRLFGLALGGTCLAKAGLAAQDLAAGGDQSQRGRIGLARFFAEKLATAAPGLARSIASGAGALEGYETILESA